MKDSSPSASERIEPFLIDSIEAARLLNTSTKTLQRIRDRGAIPYRMIGATIRYRPEDVREYANKTQTMLPKREKAKPE